MADAGSVIQATVIKLFVFIMLGIEERGTERKPLVAARKTVFFISEFVLSKQVLKYVKEVCLKYQN